MPDATVQRVDKIGTKQKVDRTLSFANCNKEYFAWADEIPKDDSEFQGLLEDESPFPDVLAKLQGVQLESEEPTKAVEDVT